MKIEKFTKSHGIFLPILRPSCICLQFLRLFEEHKIWCLLHLVVKMWRLQRLISLLRNSACELGARSLSVNCIDHLKLYEWPVCFKNSSFARTTVSTNKHILSLESLSIKTRDNQITQNYFYLYVTSKYLFKMHPLKSIKKRSQFFMSMN